MERNQVFQRLPPGAATICLPFIHLTQLLTNCSRGERHEKWPWPLVIAIDESRKMCQISVTNRRPNTLQPPLPSTHHNVYIYTIYKTHLAKAPRDGGAKNITTIVGGGGEAWNDGGMVRIEIGID